MWPNTETAQTAIEVITSVSTYLTGVKIFGGVKGSVLAEFD